MTGRGDDLDARGFGAIGDLRLVADAANGLDTTEFALFKLAHEAWFGAPGRQEELERAFARYMRRGAAPSWVRHFARRVLALPTDAERRRLHRALHPESAIEGPPPGGRLYVLATAGVVGAFLLLLLGVSDNANPSAPIACRGGPGMPSFVATAARAFGAEIAC